MQGLEEMSGRFFQRYLFFCGVLVDFWWQIFSNSFLTCRVLYNLYLGDSKKAIPDASIHLRFSPFRSFFDDKYGMTSFYHLTCANYIQL